MNIRKVLEGNPLPRFEGTPWASLDDIRMRLEDGEGHGWRQQINEQDIYDLALLGFCAMMQQLGIKVTCDILEITLQDINEWKNRNSDRPVEQSGDVGLSEAGMAPEVRTGEGAPTEAAQPSSFSGISRAPRDSNALAEALARLDTLGRRGTFQG